jgi:hypothetical protein
MSGSYLYFLGGRMRRQTGLFPRHRAATASLTRRHGDSLYSLPRVRPLTSIPILPFSQLHQTCFFGFERTRFPFLVLVDDFLCYFLESVINSLLRTLLRFSQILSCSIDSLFSRRPFLIPDAFLLSAYSAAQTKNG